jgi:hypothetical protein
MTPGLREAAEAARELAGRSINPADHAVANALEAAVKVEQNRALLAALSEPPTPETAPPPWSEVSEPGTSEGPLNFGSR